MKFLSIITRVHPQRKSMLHNCITSVQNIKSNDVEQIFIHDKSSEGGGRVYANQMFYIHRKEICPKGKYIMVLDDDDMIINPHFITNLKNELNNRDPEMIIFKGNVTGLGTLPPSEYWKKDLIRGKVASFCAMIKKDLWFKNIKSFGVDKNCGDYIFLKKVYHESNNVYWFDNIVAETQRVSLGRSE